MKTAHDLIDDITRFIFIEDEPCDADVIFVPGNASYLPAERAAELYQKGLAPLVVPSGRAPFGKERFHQSSVSRLWYDGDYPTECDFITDILQKNGVPCKAILGEKRAEYTKQNAAFSALLLKEQGICIKKAIICCKSIHARRALMYYTYYFKNVSFCVSTVETRGVDKATWYESPTACSKIFAELSKIGTQFPALMPSFASNQTDIKEEEHL